MTETIFAENTITGFSYNSLFGAYVYSTDTPLFVMVAGQEYTIVWDSVEYVRKASSAVNAFGDAVVYLGNTLVEGKENSGEPFAIVDDNENFYLLALDDKESHDVAIYMEVEATANGIVLKDRDGKDVTYDGVKTIRVNYSDGSKKNFVDESTMPELIEETFELDFSDGDMGYAPGRLGKAYSEIIIKQPETLIPENIAEGVNIAGIVGALAGGKNVKIYDRWSVKPTSSSVHTITHNLGVVPDIVLVHLAGNMDGNKKGMLVWYGCSNAIFPTMGSSMKQYVLYQSNTSGYITQYFSSTASITDTSVTAGKAWISGANATSVKIHQHSSSTGIINTSGTYHVLIIGGLT